MCIRDRVNTTQGMFNIPVPIDTLKDKTTESLNRTAKIINNPETSSFKKQFMNSLEQPTTEPHLGNIDDIENGENNTSSILGTIFSMAHNVVSHVPMLSSTEHLLTGSNHNLRKPGATPSTRNIDDDQSNRTMGSSNANNANDNNNNTVVHSPPGAVNRSTSFLRHLDTLLSPASDSKVDSEPSKTPNIQEGTPMPSNTNYSDDRLKKGITEDFADEDDIRSQAGKVKFEPLHTVQPAISTFGKGNLTLDAFSGPVPTLEDEHEDEQEYNALRTIGSNNITIDSRTKPPQTLQENARNSSYIDLAHHGVQEIQQQQQILDSRARSRTVPANETLRLQDAAKNIKRNSRYSTLSNDEIPNNADDERKPRSMSKNFLNRRSFSPAHIGMKVIPSIALRNSVTRPRNSTEVTDPQRTRSSTNMSLIILQNGSRKFQLRGIKYSTEKKNLEFQNLFRDAGISPTERLIVDHSCALSRDILLQGRMYISDQHICFYSNILGWVSTIIIAFKEIVQIEKKTTAGIFPNGIVIDTLHTKYIFASFITRDATFDLITDVWNQLILGRRNIKSTGDINDDELGSTYMSDLDSTDLSDIYDDEDDDDLNGTDLTSSEGMDDDEFGEFQTSKIRKRNATMSTTPMKHAPTTVCLLYTSRCV